MPAAGAGGKRGGASLKQLLEGVLGNMDLRARFGEHLAMAAWPDVAGRLVGAHAWVEGVRDGVLMIATDTPAWAQELQMRRTALLERLSVAVGQGVIRDIHFRSGVRRRGRKEERQGPPLPADVKLSGREEKRIRAAAAQIEDSDLGRRAERAFRSLTRLGHWRKQAGWRRCRRCGNWQRVGRRWCSSCAHAGAGGRKRRQRGSEA